LLLQPRAMGASGNVPLTGDPNEAPAAASSPASPPESAPEPIVTK
jgi:hypothetical protein